MRREREAKWLVMIVGGVLVEERVCKWHEEEKKKLKELEEKVLVLEMVKPWHWQ